MNKQKDYRTEVENGTRKVIGWCVYEYFFGKWVLVDNQ